MEKLSRFRSALEYLHTVLHHTIGHIRAEHQANVMYVAYLAEHPKPLQLITGVPVLNSP